VISCFDEMSCLEACTLDSNLNVDASHLNFDFVYTKFTSFATY
jgi:hypothetical protein